MKITGILRNNLAIWGNCWNWLNMSTKNTLWQQEKLWNIFPNPSAESLFFYFIMLTLCVFFFKISRKSCTVSPPTYTLPIPPLQPQPQRVRSTDKVVDKTPREGVHAAPAPAWERSVLHWTTLPREMGGERGVSKETEQVPYPIWYGKAYFSL